MNDTRGLCIWVVIIGFGGITDLAQTGRAGKMGTSRTIHGAGCRRNAAGSASQVSSAQGEASVVRHLSKRRQCRSTLSANDFIIRVRPHICSMNKASGNRLGHIHDGGTPCLTLLLQAQFRSWICQRLS